MKKLIFTFALLAFSTISLAVEALNVPESRVSTPVQSEISANSLELSQNDSENWAKRREERRVARKQILAQVQNSKSSEKSEIQSVLLKNRNENSRMNDVSPKTEERRRNSYADVRGMQREQRFGDTPPNGIREERMPR